MSSQTEPLGVAVKAGREGDLTCGVAKCQPRALQRCANMKMYAFLLALQFMFHISVRTYFMGVTRTVERRFGFSTQDTGVIGSAGDAIQTVFVLFVGYFGRKTHKPRYISCSVLVSSLSSFMLAFPYFIYGSLPLNNGATTSTLESSDQLTNATWTPASSTIYQMCELGSSNTSLSQCGLEDDGKEIHSDNSAYLIFLLAFILLNLGGCGLHTLGIAYIDENVKKEDSGVYIGAVMSVFAVGPILGFSLAAFSTSMSEDLTQPTISTTDPQFIGCWWVGGVILGTMKLLAAVPLFFFPKHFDAYYRYHKRPPKKRRMSQVALSTVAFEMKQFPKSLYRLVTTPSLAFLLLSKVSSAYLIIGVFINIPRYMEIHFRQPAFVANIGSAFGGVISGGLGNVCGGLMMKKWNLQPTGSAKVYTLSLVATIIGVFIMMFLACPQGPVYGLTSPDTKWVEVANECNTDCVCDRDRFQSVCSPDGELYFSPCHAGCHNYSNGSYAECTCTAANVTTLSGDHCPGSCSLYFAYITTISIVSFLGNMARIPATVLMFRLVDEELKAFALGLMSSLFNLLVFVPGPVMFGTLFDSTCLLWQSKCGSRGACLLFDVDHFRLYMHGVSEVFLLLSLILAGVMQYYVKKQFAGKQEGSQGGGNDADEEEPEEDALPLNAKLDDAS